MRKLLHGILASSLILSLGTVSFATEPTEILGETQVYTQTLSTSPESDFTMGDGGIITKYTGDGENVVIPSTIGGRTVYGIGERAFQNMTSIDSVTMPSTLERIEGFAFDGCTNLRSVTLNEGLEYLGLNAFARTTNLRDAWIPSTVLEMAQGVFYSSGLTSVYVPATVRIMGTHVFQECSRLTEAIIMANVDELPASTFLDSIMLENVYLREGIQTIANGSFKNCTSLENITLPSTLNSIVGAFEGCTKLQKMDLTNTKLTSIDGNAFVGCTSLEEVVFPYGFLNVCPTMFYGVPFSGCTSLKKVVFPSSTTRFQTNYDVAFANNHADFAIYGYAGSWAETYAESKKLSFVSLGSASSENKNPTITPTTPPELPTKPDVSTPTVTPDPTPEVSLPSVNTDMSDKLATPSDVKVTVNGAVVSFAPYAIEGFNYFKLTDMAFALDGTGKQFEVTWDMEKSAINMVTGSGHRHLGTEMQGNSGKSEVAERFNSTVYKNGEAIQVLVYTIDGSSYFQLDTLKSVLGIDVGWDGATSTITIST